MMHRVIPLSKQRGYTYGFVAEYYDRWGAARFGEMLMPTVANGITLDWDLARAG